MSTPFIVQRPQAITDLAEIWDYIADDSEGSVDSFIDHLDRKIRALARRPGIGRAREELAEGLRSFPVGRYTIFYHTIPKGIEIVRVLHGARDLEIIFHKG
jgi:toxin ParE1/3/4